MGSALAAILGAPFGALLAFLIVLAALPPSVADMEADAAALLLPGSEMVSIGSNTGATIIVGWDRWSTAEFEDERSAPGVHGLLVERAMELGWSVERAQAVQVGLVIEASKPLTKARITVGSQVEGGERIGASAGRITVSRHEERRTILFWGSVGLGALAGVWLGQRFLSFVRRSSARGQD